MSLGLFRPKYYSLPLSARFSFPPWASFPFPSSFLGRWPNPFAPPSEKSPFCVPPLHSNNFSVSKWFQMKKLSITKLYNLSRSTTFVLVILLYDFVSIIWIWISNYDNFKQHFQILNDFNWKSHQQQSCITHQYLQLLFWSFCYMTLFQ